LPPHHVGTLTAAATTTRPASRRPSRSKARKACSPTTTVKSRRFDVLPKPSYDPSIARFSFEDGEAELVEMIPLRDSTGHPFSGLVNSLAPTGGFWVSDEYGPFVTHFTAQGKELSRLSPVQDGTRSAARRAEEPGAEPRHGGSRDHPRRTRWSG
jgi:hypothetical protein